MTCRSYEASGIDIWLEEKKGKRRKEEKDSLKEKRREQQREKHKTRDRRNKNKKNRKDKQSIKERKNRKETKFLTNQLSQIRVDAEEEAATASVDLPSLLADDEVEEPGPARFAEDRGVEEEGISTFFSSNGGAYQENGKRRDRSRR
jgi:flagellar biosynthesis GTPase FlhF